MENNNANLVIRNDDDKFIIELKKSFIANASRSDIDDLIAIALSPIFLTTPKDKPILKNKIKIDSQIIGNIAIFMDVSSSFTGGRYSIVHQAVLLGELFNVDIVVDRNIDYLMNNFKCYNGYKNVKVIIDSSYLSQITDNKYEFVIGLPNISAQYAHIYCDRFKILFVIMAFETPNYISMFRSGIDSDEGFWANFKKVAKLSTVRISPSKLSSKFFKKWLNVDDENFYVVRPCMNTIVAKQVLDKDDRYSDYCNDYVMSTRVVNFKNPINILKIIERKQIPLTLHHIGTIADNNFDFEGFDYIKVIKHGNVDDYEKFKIINSCKAMIHPSKFEGFGMPPMEALFFNKPVFCYNIPVLKELYDNRLIYSKDENEFAKKLIEFEKIEYVTKIVDKPEFINPENCLNELLSFIKNYKTLNVVVGIIAFNCNDYIDTVIRSIYDYVDKIIIVEGCVKENIGNANDKYHSTDGTYEYLTGNEIYDPLNKMKIILRENRAWNDKIEMQNAIATFLKNGDIYIKIDGDEVWDGNTINKVINFMNTHRNIDIIRMPFLHFWTSFSIIAKDAGGKWNTKHPRVWRIGKKFKHIDSFNYFVDEQLRKVTYPHYNEFIWESTEPIYHFGYARELEYVKQKLIYYKNRGIEKHVDVDLYRNWKTMSDLTQPTQIVRSWAEKFNETKLPDIMRRHKYYNVADIRKLIDE